MFEQTVEYVVNEYKNGVGLEEIARKIKSGRGQVRRLLTEAGVEINGKGRPTIAHSRSVADRVDRLMKEKVV